MSANRALRHDPLKAVFAGQSVESRALAELVVVVLQPIGRAREQRCQPRLAVHQRQSHQTFAVEKQSLPRQVGMFTRAGRAFGSRPVLSRTASRRPIRRLFHERAASCGLIQAGECLALPVGSRRSRDAGANEGALVGMSGRRNGYPALSANLPQLPNKAGAYVYVRVPNTTRERHIQPRALPPVDHREAAARFRLLADIEPWPNFHRHFSRLATQHEELAAALKEDAPRAALG
jgi:hypothetical protein